MTQHRNPIGLHASVYMEETDATETNLGSFPQEKKKNPEIGDLWEQDPNNVRMWAGKEWIRIRQWNT